MSDARKVISLGVSKGSSALPPLHNTWLGMLSGISDPPSEPKATCGDCVMCGGVERSGSHVTFTPDAKCCTYIPHLANFLAGLSLLGPGRDSINARIQRRQGVTPLGLGLSYADIGRLVAERSDFGQSPVVVCPHFVAKTQGCAIWQTRNAVCSTWFCQHERGAVTQRFWHAIRDLLIAVEERVARQCLFEGGLPQDQVSAVLGHREAIRDIIARANAGEPPSGVTPVDDSPDWYERMWGDWVGREADWFRLAADFAATIGQRELTAWVQELGPLSEAVRDRFTELDVHDLPEGLIFAPGAGSEATPDLLRLVGYSPFDPVALPAALLPQLQRLDGTRIAGAQHEGTALDKSLLQLLHDFGIAIEAEPRPDPAT